MNHNEHSFFAAARDEGWLVAIMGRDGTKVVVFSLIWNYCGLFVCSMVCGFFVLGRLGVWWFMRERKEERKREGMKE